MKSRLHSDEVTISADFARRLVMHQFPEWGNLSIRSFNGPGTDHALFRLGHSLVLRFPRIPGAVSQIAKEQAWLPRLARELPLPVPLPIAQGSPGPGFPWPWAVYRWLPGRVLPFSKIRNVDELVSGLVCFLRILREIEPPPELLAGEHNGGRGAPLASRDERVLAGLRALSGDINVESAARIWTGALRAPPHKGRAVMLHGDINSGNLLFKRGRLAAVIDFGCLGAGDPACDLAIAWSFLDAPARQLFRERLEVSDAEWERGRGWALSVALIALPYYRHTHPFQAEISAHTIQAVLEGTR